MSVIHLTIEESEAAAKSMGLVIRKPKANELFLDIDNAHDLDIFTKHVEKLSDIVKAYVATPSKSGGSKKHIVVTLHRPVKSLTERLLLQAVLGSDRLRELLGWKRIEAGNKNCSLLFEKP